MSVGDAAMTRSIVAGRGLLLQRLGQLAVARLHLLEQPHVLDGDHRLVGEGLEQLDLLVAERAHLGAADHRRRRSARPRAAADAEDRRDRRAGELWSSVREFVLGRMSWIVDGRGCPTATRGRIDDASRGMRSSA